MTDSQLEALQALGGLSAQAADEIYLLRRQLAAATTGPQAFGSAMDVSDWLSDNLRRIADGGIDSGGWANERDLWATLAGTEYYITVAKSKRQLVNEAEGQT